MKNTKSSLAGLTQKAGFSSFMSSLLAIGCGLIVGLVVLLISDPANALGGFMSILAGAFSSMKDLGQVFYMATPIILTGLSVGFANKTGLFNIGGPGQFIVGAYAAVLVGVKCTFIPGALLWVVCLIAAMLAGALGGAIWGFVPGFLKAKTGAHEVIITIMMNVKNGRRSFQE